MGAKNERINIRLDAELADAAKALAESEGASVADIARRALQREVSGCAPVGAQDTVQPAVQDYGEQLELMERKMDVLQQGMLAMAERQAAEVAALVAIAERQEAHERGMRALASGMQAIAESTKQLPAKEQPALPEPKQKLRKAIPTALDDCAKTHARVVYVRM